MGDVVNLNRFRKAKARSDKAAGAEANRMKFGRSKTEKAAEEAEAERRARELDGAKLED